MPPAQFPPTPAPSTDIKGREGKALTPNETAFSLPPSAVNGAHNDSAAAFSSPQYNLARKDSNNSSDVSLPPPPSRSRKIIQVKPKGSSEERDATYTPSAKPIKPAAKETAGKRKSAAGSQGTAAGRKVARKTAHSIIERRRRSKMNEEFGVLKDLIPACRGCEMHKLAILQASIEYLRYLENCVSELKAGRATSTDAPSLPSRSSLPSVEEVDHEADDHDEPSDDEMEVDDAQSTSVPPYSAQPDRKLSVAVPGTSSTAISAMSPHSRPTHRSSTSSTAGSTLPSPYFGPVTSHISLAAYSTTTSPTFGPIYSAPTHRQSSSRGSASYSPAHAVAAPSSSMGYAHQPFGSFSRNSSAQTSPVIYPQHQGLNEAEASSALLMLNQDRRRESAAAPKTGERRGMSVKDLLSS